MDVEAEIAVKNARLFRTFFLRKPCSPQNMVEHWLNPVRIELHFGQRISRVPGIKNPARWPGSIWGDCELFLQEVAQAFARLHHRKFDRDTFGEMANDASTHIVEENGGAHGWANIAIHRGTGQREVDETARIARTILKPQFGARDTW